MQKIIPNLWFDSEAEEAAKYYSTLLPHSRVGAVTRYGKEGFEIHGQPEGKVMTVEFELAGYKFVGINGGPHFKFTPAISFWVVCETEKEVDTLWGKLSEGGAPLMELQKYDWSEKYGWIMDNYGLTWQISLGRLSDVGQTITPSLLFVGRQHGRAEEAIRLYSSIFRGSNSTGILRYGAGESPEKEGTVKHAQFSLGGEVFMAMDSALEHSFTFNEAISLMVNCESQEEVDYFWEKLSEGGDEKAQQCGWLKDRYGVSWQVSPTVLQTMITDPDPKKVARVTKAFLAMKKFDIAELQKAFEGK